MIYRDPHTRLSITTPIFDRTIFEQLVEDLEPDSALEFLTTFTSLLGLRITRIEQALPQGGQDDQGVQDSGELIEALLSLRASAAMVGARRLEVLTTTVLTETGAPDIVGRSVARQLHDEAQWFTAATARLQHPSAYLAA